MKTPNIGDKLHIWQQARTYKIHIVAVVDDNQVVFKWYGKHKQWWHYEVLHIEDLRWRVDLAKDRMKEFKKEEDSHDQG